MAMIQGDVTIAADGSASGTGAAKEVFDSLDATIDYGPLTGTELQTARTQTANLAKAISVIIPHITTNGKATITTSDSGLQTIPATPVSEDDPCKAPAATKYLSIE